MGLLGRAKNLFKGLATAPEAALQYYNVVCPLGHRVRGQRTEGYQALRCPACGEGVFVLPASPLPDPGPRLSMARPRRAAELAPSSRTVEEGPIKLEEAAEATVDVGDLATAAQVEISWEDDAETANDVEPVPTRSELRPPARVKPARDEPGRTSPRRASVRGGALAHRPALDAEIRSTRRPAWRPIWLFVAVAVVVAGTVALRVGRNLRQGYPQVAELGRTEGIPALESGDFDRAHQILAPAKSAVDALGGQVEEADRIRQAADEAALYVDLAGEGLEDMLDEAARSSTPKAWATLFENRYKGRGVLFDTKVKSTPADAARRYEIEYVVLPAGDLGSFRAGGARPERSAQVDLKGFELFDLAEPKTGDRVVFGARLAALEYDAEGRGWVVRLEPKSGLFVQFPKALDSLGWPEPDPTSAPDAGAQP